MRISDWSSDVCSSDLEAFARRLAAVRQGDPLDPMTQLGAQASQIQFEKIKGYLELAPREGATVLTGGKPARIEGLEEGYFIEPTIFTDVRNEIDRKSTRLNSSH